MIQIKNVEVHGFKAVSRNIHNFQAAESDSYNGFFFEEDFKEAKENGSIGQECVFKRDFIRNGCTFVVGENDMELMRALVKSSSGRPDFAEMIDVTCDVAAPLYFWDAFSRYKTTAIHGIDSLMHKIHAKEFTLDDFSQEHLISYGDEVGCFVWGFDDSYAKDVLEHTICALNYYRTRYLETKDKKYCQQIIQLLPASYNQKRTVRINYQVLWSMYQAKKSDELDEWQTFCSWIETLPYFHEIFLEG